jgi:hypothetical protein
MELGQSVIGGGESESEVNSNQLIIFEGVSMGW